MTHPVLDEIPLRMLGDNFVLQRYQWEELLGELWPDCHLLVFEINESFAPLFPLGTDEVRPALDARPGVVLTSQPEIAEICGGNRGCGKLFRFCNTKRRIMVSQGGVYVVVKPRRVAELECFAKLFWKRPEERIEERSIL